MVLNVISLVLAGWVLWKAFRWFVIGCSLDNIPGPQSDSFVTGKQFVHFTVHVGSRKEGVMPRFFGGSGFNFHREMVAKCATQSLSVPISLWLTDSRTRRWWCREN